MLVVAILVQAILAQAILAQAILTQVGWLYVIGSEESLGLIVGVFVVAVVVNGCLPSLQSSSLYPSSGEADADFVELVVELELAVESAVEVTEMWTLAL